RAGHSRSGVPTFSELHQLPPKGPRIQREPGLVQMRLLLALILTMVPALAQQADPPSKAADQAAQTPAQGGAKPADQAAAPAAASNPAPASAGEPWFSGSLDLGYRWRIDN